MLSLSKKIIFLPLVLVSVLTACSPVDIPNPTLYQLAPVLPDKGIPKKSSHLSLLVSQPQAAPTYQTDKMIYVKAPYQIGYFTENRWSAEPAKMLQPLIMQSLQNTNYFTVVTSTPFSGYTDLRLDTTLLKLQQNFTTNPSMVELAIDVRLVSTITQHVIAGKRFVVTVPAENNPGGGAQAANQAIASFLEQLNSFLINVNYISR